MQLKKKGEGRITRHLCKATGVTKSQALTTPPKDHSKLSVADPKEMDILKLPDKEFKIIILKMHREIQENTNKQFNEIRKTIQEQNEKFNWR